jgi:transcription-repair coupling factor (superfamily II helicase)
VVKTRPFESLLVEVAANGEFRRLVRDLERRAPSLARATGATFSPLHVSGLTAAAKPLFALLLRRQLRAPLLYVTSSNRESEQAFDLLSGWARLLGEPEPNLIPAHDIRPYQGLSPHADISEKRALGLARLASGQTSLSVLPVEAVAARTEPPEFYRGLVRQLRRHDEVELEELVEHLEAVGYLRHDPVEMAGQFSVRGGIVDVFSPEARRPVRLELFGDEVESLREFDVETQRSTGAVERVALLPLTEFPLRKELLEELSDRLHAATTETFVAGEPFPGWEFRVPLVQPLAHTLLDLSPQAILFLEEPTALEQDLERLWLLLGDEYAQARLAGRAAPPQEYYLRWDQILEQGRQRQVICAEELGLARPPAAAESFHFSTHPAPSFHGHLERCLAELDALLQQQYRIVMLTGGAGETERLAELLTEHRTPFHRAESSAEALPARESLVADEIDLPACWLGRGGIPHGVLLPDAKLLVLGTQDLFDVSTAAARPAAARSHISTFLSDFRDLEPGDYVVHVENGIGCYRGLKELTADGLAQEFMELEYKEGDRLYVPLTRLDLVQKYRAMEGARPALDRLGGLTWARTKARVKKAMQEMAGELLKLYAGRETAVGIRFVDENPWQRELEEAFEFDETPDQLRTIEEVRRDMEGGRPMDRLVCGDVGYGKTEVAMRAAFRAALHSKQVAVLAPTTVLAYQHYETFRQRFAAFPVRVELLSRFRTAAEQKKVLRELEAGRVDVVIGTHRLLSKDVVFHDLGLLIVDEEQRFGVRHKERIKALKQSVDVLSLSATPIPRTLHMALAGLRDMSLIETPPRDRLSIQTVVAPFSESIIRTALAQELERGGQVYFVHNRVQSLPAMAALVQKLAPRARIGMAHGQMNERQLEKVMLLFLRHETDVLVATTIIENGLDIPLVNTIIINRADRMGLGELYQLRGRVGRSSRRAYAYLLVPPEAKLTPVARKRLGALKEFSELGSGFRVAALDMELRGAGNLLGGQQHGHVNAIGLELYCQMLEGAVRELRGEAARPEFTATINLGLDIRIPASYIQEEHQRLRMYKNLGGIRSAEERDNVEQELHDRYGPVPGAVRNLLDYAALKLLAERLWVRSIERKKEAIEIQFHAESKVDPAQLTEFIAAQPGAQFTPAGVLRLPLRGHRGDLLPWLQQHLERLMAE